MAIALMSLGMLGVIGLNAYPWYAGGALGVCALILFLPGSRAVSPTNENAAEAAAPLKRIRRTNPTRGKASVAMDRYAEGEDPAFETVYDVLTPHLRHHLGRQRDPETEDLIHRTMLHVHAARGRFIRGADVVPWALGVATALKAAMDQRGAKRSGGFQNPSSGTRSNSQRPKGLPRQSRKGESDFRTADQDAPNSVVRKLFDAMRSVGDAFADSACPALA
jgi:DNA-directed RNA polymerase specialized sigma24 family protein